MTEEIIPKEPTEDQIRLIKSYNHLCDNVLSLLSLCEPNHFLQNAADRIVESIGWFTHYTANGGNLLKDVKPKQEISPTEAAKLN